MGPYKSKIFKTLLLPQLTLEYFETSTEFSSLSLRFLTIFFRKCQIYHCSLGRSQILQLSGKRAILEQKGVKCGTRG